MAANLVQFIFGIVIALACIIVCNLMCWPWWTSFIAVFVVSCILDGVGKSMRKQDAEKEALQEQVRKLQEQK
jgi:hypothetical protein